MITSAAKRIRLNECAELDTDDILAIPGYNVIIRKDRAGIGKGLGGCIILYHKDYIKVDRRQECIWVEIRTKPQQTLRNFPLYMSLFTPFFTFREST